MNERIKELWEEGAQSSWPRPGKFTAGEYDFHLEKFAQLIIEECAKMIDEQEIQSNYGDMVRKHFGVI